MAPLLFRTKALRLACCRRARGQAASRMKQRSNDVSRKVPAVVLGDLSLVRPLNWAGIPVVMGTDDTTDPGLWSRHVKSSFVLPGYSVDKRRHSAAQLQEIGERLVRRHGQRIPLIYGQDA